jgi:hypothetical protein
MAHSECGLTCSRDRAKTSFSISMAIFPIRHHVNLSPLFYAYFGPISFEFPHTSSIVLPKSSLQWLGHVGYSVRTFGSAKLKPIHRRNPYCSRIKVPVGCLLHEAAADRLHSLHDLCTLSYTNHWPYTVNEATRVSKSIITPNMSGLYKTNPATFQFKARMSPSLVFGLRYIK